MFPSSSAALSSDRATALYGPSVKPDLAKNHGCLVASEPCSKVGKILFSDRALLDPSYYADFRYTDNVLKGPFLENIALKNVRAIHTETLLETVCRVVFEYTRLYPAQKDDEVSTEDGTTTTTSENNASAVVPATLLDVSSPSKRPGAEERVTKLIDRLRILEQQLTKNDSFRKFCERSNVEELQEEYQYALAVRSPKSSSRGGSSSVAAQQHSSQHQSALPDKDGAGSSPAQDELSSTRVLFDANDEASVAVVQAGGGSVELQRDPAGHRYRAGGAEYETAVRPSEITDHEGNVTAPALAMAVIQQKPSTTPASASSTCAGVENPHVIEISDHADAAPPDPGSSAEMRQLAIPNMNQLAPEEQELRELETADLAIELHEQWLRPEFQKKITKNDLDALLQIYLNCYVLDDKDDQWISIAEDWDDNSSEAVAAYALPAVVKHSSTPNCFIGPLMRRFLNENNKGFGDSFIACQPETSALTCSAGEQNINSSNPGGFFMTTSVEIRALKPIEKGEPLTVDFVGFPDCYAPVKSQEKSHLEFEKEKNPRWKSALEITRCFTCPSGGADEFCTHNVDPAEVWNHPLSCRACGQKATPEFAQRCRQAEQDFMRRQGCSAADAYTPEAPMSKHHYMVFAASWFYFHEGLLANLETVNKQDGTKICEVILECLERVYGSHPVMLRFVSFLQCLHNEDLALQRQFLDEEQKIVAQFFPDEAERLNKEVTNLLERNGAQFQKAAESVEKDPNAQEEEKAALAIENEN